MGPEESGKVLDTNFSWGAQIVNVDQVGKSQD